MLVIRMRRAGSKKRPFFRVVVTEHSSPRDGRFVEVVGHYKATTTPETIVLNGERVNYWLSKGAQPSDTVRTLIARNPQAMVAKAADVAAAEQAAQ
jgi:small subunit ribosomal protein S16